MERAQDLAMEMLGYIPPPSQVTAGHCYDLKPLRYGRPIPFEAEIIPMHVDRIHEAENRRRGGSATTVLGSRKWRQNLAKRQYLASFNIPAAIVLSCKIQPNRKRQVEIAVSTGKRLGGFCTISSGTELLVPTKYQELLRDAEYFECEIVGNETSDTVTLALM